MTPNFINLTGELVVILRKPPADIVGSTGDPLILEPSLDMEQVRIRRDLTQASSLHGIPVFYPSTEEIENLPEPAPNTVYIVPEVIAWTARRMDVLCPGPDVFDSNDVHVGNAGLLTFAVIDQFYSQAIKKGGHVH